MTPSNENSREDVKKVLLKSFVKILLHKHTRSGNEANGAAKEGRCHSTCFDMGGVLRWLTKLPS